MISKSFNPNANLLDMMPCAATAKRVKTDFNLKIVPNDRHFKNGVLPSTLPWFFFLSFQHFVLSCDLLLLMLLFLVVSGNIY